MSTKNRIAQYPTGGKYIKHVPLEEYSELFKDFFVLTRVDGILEIRWHSNNGPVMMDHGHSKAWAQLLKIAGEDPENEIMILTGTGEYFVAGINPECVECLKTNRSTPAGMIGESYDDVYLDGMEGIKALLFNVNVPTIGVFNGPAYGMQQMVTMCDITLCADDVIFDEQHFMYGKMPGTGSFLALQKYLGEKRANHMLFTGHGITADEAQRNGLVSEVLPREKLLPRAWEIAERMMKVDRKVRRLSHDMASKGLRSSFVSELEYQMAMSTYGHVLTVSDTLGAIEDASN
jgi:enoyl-CoA hydratase/carnithine racemase